MQMYVRELMTPHVISAAPTDTLADARTQLRDHCIHHLVVMEQKQLVGVLSYRDLIGKNDGESVASVMSRDIVTVTPHDTVRNAASRMLGRTHGCAAVVDAGEVTGVITTTDLLRAVSLKAANA